MSGYSCLIFDDEPAAIMELSFLIGKYAPHWKIAGIASTIHDCKKALHEHFPDVIFTDIHFGENIIFDILPELKSFKGDIIFVSGDNGFASQAFELSAANYFLKPINELKFKKFIEEFTLESKQKTDDTTREVLFHNLAENKSSLKKIAFSTNTGYLIRELSDIVYVKANSNYTEFYFSDSENLLATKTLLVYEKMLEDFGFFRVHQSFLVNFKYVARFDSDYLQLYLTTGDIIPVSNRRKSQLLDILRGVF